MYDRQKFKRGLSVASIIFVVTIIACGGIGPQVDVEATVAAGVEGTRQAETRLQATIAAAVAATQQAGQTGAARGAGDGVIIATPTPLPSPATPTPAPQPPDQREVTAVISSEVNGLIAKDLARLQSLYAPDAVIIDRRGSPADRSDDTVWNGWANIAQRYLALFAADFSSLTLVDLAVQINGQQATGTYEGLILDGLLYEDKGIYTLENSNGAWLITQLEYGHQPGYAFQPSRDDGLYILAVGNQHRYEEPWGWDRGDPCEAWRTGNFDDTKPNYRGFNVELLLTNHSESKVPDDWSVSFTTAKGKSVRACRYSYEGAGPPPGATSSVTFFTVVEKGDYVERITLNLNDQVIRLCLDGRGGWQRCDRGR